jgi:hypothetical protein
MIMDYQEVKFVRDVTIGNFLVDEVSFGEDCDGNRVEAIFSHEYGIKIGFSRGDYVSYILVPWANVVYALQRLDLK